MSDVSRRQAFKLGAMGFLAAMAPGLFKAPAKAVGEPLLLESSLPEPSIHGDLWFDSQGSTLYEVQISDNGGGVLLGGWCREVNSERG